MHSTQAEPIGGQKEEASDGYTPTTTLKRQPSMSLTDNTGNPKRKRGTKQVTRSVSEGQTFATIANTVPR